MTERNLRYTFTIYPVNMISLDKYRQSRQAWLKSLKSGQADWPGLGLMLGGLGSILVLMLG